MDISRRALLGGFGLGAAAVLAGCGSHRSANAPTSTPAPTPSPTPTTQLPQLAAWNAKPGEVNPAVKARATQLLQAVGSWTSGGAAAARDRASAAGYDPALVDSLGFLTPTADAAVTNFVDVQYGGILDDSASVMAMAVQWYQDADGRIQRHGSTFDVRLERAEPHWTVTAIHPADPGAAAASLSALAQAALGNDRIRFTDSAHADVTAGQIHDSVLQALTTLSDKHVLDVSVLRSGHPLLVFGTDRQSDHPYGRAADVWAIDGKAVVDPANLTEVEAFMREAATVGPWQVGGPVDLDGPDKHMFFSDNTHHDHVHLGFHT